MSKDSSTKHYENIIMKTSWKNQSLSIEEKKCDKIDRNKMKIFLKIKERLVEYWKDTM